MSSTLKFEKATCDRCDGTGFYAGASSINNNKCFKCHGRKVFLTTAGRAAFEAYQALIAERLMRPIADVKLGQVMEVHYGQGRYALEVTAKTQDANGWKVTHTTASGKTLDVNYGRSWMARVFDADVEAQIARELVAAYPGASYAA